MSVPRGQRAGTPLPCLATTAPLPYLTFCENLARIHARSTSRPYRANSGAASVRLASYLLACPDFALIDGTPMPTLEPFGLLDSLPAEVVDRARDWERHLVEVVTGLPPGAARAPCHGRNTTLIRPR